jgi:hypothetical protein
MREFKRLFGFSAMADFVERKLTVDVFAVSSLGEAREGLRKTVDEVTLGAEEPDSPIYRQIAELGIGEIVVASEGDTCWFLGIARSVSEAKSIALNYVLTEEGWEVLVRR